MGIPAGVILIWPGTNATIPSGWTRETSLDDKYPKSQGAEAPNTTGGSNTHSHSDGGHTHAMDAHSHSYTTGNSGTFGDSSYSGSDGGTVSGDHNHGSSSSNATSGGTLSDAVTWTSVNHEPPYYKVIFIKPSGASAPIVSGICLHSRNMWSGAVPDGWLYCDGTSGTPDIRGRYLKGASAGGDAGATGGGTSHQHTVTHTHSAQNHSHTGGIGAYSGNTRQSGGNDVGVNVIETSHSHTVTLANASVSTTEYAKTDAGASDTVEPLYKKLGILKNNGGGLRLGMMGMWLGSVASIPKNWALSDGNGGTFNATDYFMKIGANLGENGATGGSNTHAHSGIAHGHSATGSHSHSGSTSSNSSSSIGRNPTNSGALFAHKTHTHAVSSISSVTPTYQNGTTTPQTTSNQPAYRTVAYIEITKIEVGGASLLSMLM